MRRTPKWKTLAASTASAPASTAGGKCSTAPAPPLAMTGTVTSRRTDRISSVSHPARVPSASIELSRISPAAFQGVRQGRPGAEFGGAHPPLDGVETGAPPPAVGGDLEAGVGDRAVLAAPGIQRQHEHLVAEPVGDLRDQLRPGDGGGVDRDLVRTGPQQPIHVLGAAYPAADGERDEDALGRAADHVIGGGAVTGAGGDVEEREFVGALGVVDPGHLHRVAGVAQVDEVHALDDSPRVDVQARDDAHGQTHAGTPRTASASISTSIAGSISAATCTIEVAGRMSPKTSPWARPISSQREMSVTNIRVRTTSARGKPARSRDSRIVASACRVCAPASPGCTTAPSTTDVVPLTHAVSPRTTTRL